MVFAIWRTDCRRTFESLSVPSSTPPAQGLAIRTDALTRSKLEELHRRRQRLASPWGFDRGRNPSRSAAPSWSAEPRVRDIHRRPVRSCDPVFKAPLAERFARLFSHKLKGDGPVKASSLRCAWHSRGSACWSMFHIKNATAFRLAAEGVSFHRTPCAKEGQQRLFCSLYGILGEALLKGGALLFGDEAREHTAQVEQKRRQVREKRFPLGRQGAGRSRSRSKRAASAWRGRSASCRSCSARRPWNLASTSPSSTPSICAMFRRRPPTTRSAADARAAAAQQRWC